MPSTYSSLRYHVVFSTRDREPLIAPAWGGRLHEYLAALCAGWMVCQKLLVVLPIMSTCWSHCDPRIVSQISCES